MMVEWHRVGFRTMRNALLGHGMVGRKEPNVIGNARFSDIVEE
jgi:hypothetical protein